jgi:hypothetical protein
MKGAALAAALVIVALVGAGTGYLLGNANEHTATSISTRTLPAVATTKTMTATLPNLELFARIVPEVATQGQNVSIVTELYNPLTSNIALNASVIIDDSEAPCGLGIRAIGIQVYSGHYSFGNLSKANPLLLYNFSGPPPPCFIRYNYTYVFQPNSDNARVGYLSANTTLNIQYTDNLSGYWVNCSTPRPGGIGACANLQKFQPGQYTVHVFDAWGQQTIVYFEVSNPQCPKGVGAMIVNNSIYCAPDVSKDIIVQQPGYGYFLNSSITFMGVKFETICPSNYRGCPGSSSNSTIVYAAAIQLNVAFSDGTKGTLGGVIGDSTYFFVISQHLEPKVGILIEYSSNTSSYKTFLLVSPSK